MDLQGSPEMKFARSRLSNLIQGIRDSGAGADLDDADGAELGGFEEGGGDEFRPERRRRSRKERKVLFELRGKPFELRDNQREESLFGLCRTWVQGREFYPSTTGIDDDAPGPPPPPGAEAESLDALAAKEIHALPRPNAAVPMVLRPAAARPAPADHAAPADVASRAALLATYVPHWKTVKRNWHRDGLEREHRYARSLDLLRTVHNLNSQASILN